MSDRRVLLQLLFDQVEASLVNILVEGMCSSGQVFNLFDVQTCTQVAPTATIS